MKKLLIALTLMLFAFYSGIAQSNNNQMCGTDKLHERLMTTDPAYKANFISTQLKIKDIVSNQVLNPSVHRRSQVYTIPVVVHVIHLGEPVGTGTNISDAQIHGAIQGLNGGFRNFSGFGGVDTEIEFCLATRDPNGCPTTGINRVDGSQVQNYSLNGIDWGYWTCSSASEAEVKNLSKWSTSEYYNIWIVNKICGGWAGYANYPNGNEYDGAVINRTYMTYNSSVLTHELGHGFNLFHTFNGDGGDQYCPIDNNCLLDGDYICDTPPHRQSDCGTSNPCSTIGTWNNSRGNYMSYCNSKNRFTEGQKDRMLATLQVYPRKSLLNSLGCTAPNFVTAVITKSDISCYGKSDGNIKIDTSSTSNYTYNWSNSETGTMISNLSKGNYTVTITNSIGCFSVFGFNINEPDTLTSNFEIINPCYSCDGKISAIVLGGTPPYTFSWSTGNFDSIENNLCPDEYALTIVDNNNCIYNSDVFTLIQQTPIIPEIVINSDNLTIDSSFSDINWFLNGNIIPNETSSTLIPVSNGTYHVSAKDSNGCISVSTELEYDLLASVKDMRCNNCISIIPNPNNGTFRIMADIETGNAVQLKMFSPLGQVVFGKEILPTANKIDEDISVNNIALGIYLVQLVVDGEQYYKRVAVE